MGPIATADFLNKLIAITPASRDQEHIPLIVVSDPRVPDRSTAILNGEEGPVLEALQVGIDRLVAAGATAITIPCNTAHYWIDRLVLPPQVPLLHIIDASIDTLRRSVAPGAKVAVLGTPANLICGLYQRRLLAAAYIPLIPPPSVISESVLAAIRAVKGGRRADAALLLTRTLEWLTHADARACLLACTELSLATQWNGAGCPIAIDTSMALAECCLAWWGAQLKSSPTGLT